MNSASIGLWVPLAGIAFTAVFVPTVIILKQSHQKRQWRHLERMQAIKMGVPVPPAHAMPGPGSVVAIGAGVPAVAVFFAWLTTTTLSAPTSEMEETLALTAIAWGSAGLISALAMATSLVLGVLQYRAHGRDANQQPYASSKPAYDPDTFDAASSRAF